MSPSFWFHSFSKVSELLRLRLISVSTESELPYGILVGEVADLQATDFQTRYCVEYPYSCCLIAIRYCNEPPTRIKCYIRGIFGILMIRGKDLTSCCCLAYSDHAILGHSGQQLSFWTEGLRARVSKRSHQQTVPATSQPDQFSPIASPRPNENRIIRDTPNVELLRIMSRYSSATWRDWSPAVERSLAVPQAYPA